MFSKLLHVVGFYFQFDKPGRGEGDYPDWAYEASKYMYYTDT